MILVTSIWQIILPVFGLVVIVLAMFLEAEDGTHWGQVLAGILGTVLVYLGVWML